MKLKYKIDYVAAYKTFKKLRKHPENTIFVLQFLLTTNAPSLKWTYSKLLESDSGGKVAYNSEEVSDYFETLSERPEGSVGKECYKLFPNQYFLLKLSRRKSKNSDWINAKHPLNWMARRYRDTHDTWHTLTGHPNNGMGEMGVAMFSFAQTRSIGWLMIGLALLLKFGINRKNLKLVFDSYRTGKRAKFLLAENYDELLNENLESARKRLNINALSTSD